MPNDSQDSQKKKMSTKKKVLIVLGVLLLFLVGLGVSIYGFGYSLLNKLDKVTVDENNLDINSDLDKYHKIKNIALFGVDSEDGVTGRSDAIMILTIDNERKDLRVSSILRDSYVNISGHGKDKINHAYAFGGPQLSLKTINSNYDLNITDFVSVDFTTLPKIIDAVGGIDVNITQAELDSKYLKEHLDELNRMNGTNSPMFTHTGMQHLDGTQALVYARIRYTDEGDYGRTSRHQVVINALLDKFKQLSPTEYPKVLNELLPLVKTSLTSSEIMNLAKDVFKMGSINLTTSSFPKEEDSKGIMVKGVYYLDFNHEVTLNKLHNFIFNDINSD